MKKKEITLNDLMSNYPEPPSFVTPEPIEPAPRQVQDTRVESTPIKTTDSSDDIRSNKLFYIKRKYIKWLNEHQLKEGYKYTNDYLEHIIQYYIDNRNK